MHIRPGPKLGYPLMLEGRDALFRNQLSCCPVAVAAFNQSCAAVASQNLP